MKLKKGDIYKFIERKNNNDFIYGRFIRFGNFKKEVRDVYIFYFYATKDKVIWDKNHEGWMKPEDMKEFIIKHIPKKEFVVDML